MKQGKSPRQERAASELRPITFERGVAPYAEGSCLITSRDARVCALRRRKVFPAGSAER